MTLQKIEDSTPVHGFPEIHNANITELENEIADLNAKLEAKDAVIADLKTKFNAALNALRAEYLNMFDKLDNKYVKIEDNQ